MIDFQEYVFMCETYKYLYILYIYCILTMSILDNKSSKFYENFQQRQFNKPNGVGGWVTLAPRPQVVGIRGNGNSENADAKP